MTHEVITLQFGNYSNYIGAHYWNLQENQFVYNSEENPRDIPDVNHDVLFREGLSIDNRLTYSPRMILFDLKDNINVYKSTNQPSESEKHHHHHHVHTWKGDLKVYESEKKDVSPYSIDMEMNELEQINLEKSHKHVPVNHVKEHYEMDEHVKYWSDYMKLKYNERSYMLVNQYQALTKEAEPFDLYNYGFNVFSEAEFSETYEDNLRHFAEECDQIQGFQLFVDSFNGFGGVSEKALNLINEEYPKIPILSILSYPYFNDQANDANTLKLINSSLTLKSLLVDNDDMFVVPLSMFHSFYLSEELNPAYFNSVNYKPDLNYHTSAILACLIDSITLPWRQKSQKTSMNDILELFDINKYKIASLQAVFPFKLNENKYFFDYLQEHDLFKTSRWFTPLCTDNSNSNPSGAFTITCRGINDDKVKNPRDNYYFKDVISAYSVLDRYSIDMYPKSRSKCYSIQTPLNVSLPFPDIFEKEALNQNKNKDLSLLTILQINKSILNFVKTISTRLDKVNMSKLTKYFENGMEHDDFIELKAFNQELCDIYSV